MKKQEGQKKAGKKIKPQAPVEFKPKQHKDRSKLHSGTARAAVVAPLKEESQSRHPYQMPDLMELEEVLDRTLRGFTLHVDLYANGQTSIEAGLLLATDRNGRPTSLRLGRDKEGVETKHCLFMSLDRVACPRIRQEEMGDGRVFARLDKFRLREIIPKEGAEFRVLAAPKANGADTGQILLRLMVRHFRTPVLIQDFELKGCKVLFKGEIWDRDSESFVPDLLVLMDSGQELNVRTKSGWSTVRNEKGKAVLVDYVASEAKSKSRRPIGFEDELPFGALRSIREELPEKAPAPKKPAPRYKMPGGFEAEFEHG